MLSFTFHALYSLFLCLVTITTVPGFEDLGHSVEPLTPFFSFHGTFVIRKGIPFQAFKASVDKKIHTFKTSSSNFLGSHLSIHWTVAEKLLQ